MTNALIIFIRNPALGKVKTRLAATLGDHEALGIYKVLLQHTRCLTQSVSAARFLYYSDYIDEEDDWSSDFFIKHTQKGTDLGARMYHAFETVLQQHSSALIIGSDCIDLTQAILENAFTALQRYDVVLGPAEDGGYYLLGLKNANAMLFDKMEWSTENVLNATIQRVISANLTYTLLPTLSDIDTAEDWKKNIEK